MTCYTWLQKLEDMKNAPRNTPMHRALYPWINRAIAVISLANESLEVAALKQLLLVLERYYPGTVATQKSIRRKLEIRAGSYMLSFSLAHSMSCSALPLYFPPNPNILSPTHEITSSLMALLTVCSLLYACLKNRAKWNRKVFTSRILLYFTVCQLCRCHVHDMTDSFWTGTLATTKVLLQTAFQAHIEAVDQEMSVANSKDHLHQLMLGHLVANAKWYARL